MISFFRKIRQKLLSQNKVTRYLVYALGEILLVTIGILIALQINAWNSVRKAQRSEVQFIKNIKSDLKRDQEELKRIMNLNVRKVQVFDQLKTELPALYVSDKHQLDSLMSEYFATLETFWPLTGIFDAAVSSNEISTYPNEAFKSQVFNLYNAVYIRLNRNRDIMIDRWDYFARAYKYERLTGQLGQMDDADLKELIGDLAYVTKIYEVYLELLIEAELEIQNILELEK